MNAKSVTSRTKLLFKKQKLKVTCNICLTEHSSSKYHKFPPDLWTFKIRLWWNWMWNWLHGQEANIDHSKQINGCPTGPKKGLNQQNCTQKTVKVQKVYKIEKQIKIYKGL